MEGGRGEMGEEEGRRRERIIEGARDAGGGAFWCDTLFYGVRPVGTPRCQVCYMPWTLGALEFFAPCTTMHNRKRVDGLDLVRVRKSQPHLQALFPPRLHELPPNMPPHPTFPEVQHAFCLPLPFAMAFSFAACQPMCTRGSAPLQHPRPPFVPYRIIPQIYLNRH